LTRLPLDLVCLQPAPARFEAAAARLVGHCTGLLADDATITEAAGLVCELDLIVTVDTMMAHLAGALARPVWVLLDTGADWRWMRGRDDSPWYPTMRLFRQERPGSWEPVIERLVAALAGAAAAPERALQSTC
jgi:ADP-heptose:LPS heptosyltransferase